MIRIADIQTALLPLVGWRQDYNPDNNLDRSLMKSESGLYYQDAHPLLTLDNVKSIMSKDYIKRYIELKYRYDFSKTLDEIRPVYEFDETCQGTVPVALQVFFEAESFEDTLRKAISMGGDSDTLAAIACSIAEGFYPVPAEIKEKALAKLDKKLLSMLKKYADIPVLKNKKFCSIGQLFVPHGAICVGGSDPRGGQYPLRGAALLGR